MVASTSTGAITAKSKAVIGGPTSYQPVSRDSLATLNLIPGQPQNANLNSIYILRDLFLTLNLNFTLTARPYPVVAAAAISELSGFLPSLLPVLMSHAQQHDGQQNAADNREHFRHAHAAQWRVGSTGWRCGRQGIVRNRAERGRKSRVARIRCVNQV